MSMGPDFETNSVDRDPFRPRRYAFAAVTRPVSRPDVVDFAFVDEHLARLASQRREHLSLERRRQLRVELDTLLDLRLDLAARAAGTAPPTRAELEARIAAELSAIPVTDEG